MMSATRRCRAALCNQQWNFFHNAFRTGIFFTVSLFSTIMLINYLTVHFAISGTTKHNNVRVLSPDHAQQWRSLCRSASRNVVYPHRVLQTRNATCFIKSTIAVNYRHYVMQNSECFHAILTRIELHGGGCIEKIFDHAWSTNGSATRHVMVLSNCNRSLRNPLREPAFNFATKSPFCVFLYWITVTISLLVYITYR